MLLSVEFVTALCLATVCMKLAPYFPLAQQLLRGVTCWLAPTAREIADILPRQFKRPKQKTIDAENKRLAALPTEVERLLDRRAAPVQPALLIRTQKYEYLDTVLFVSVVTFGTFFVSEATSCVRGTETGTTSFSLMLTTVFFCMFSLLSVFVFLAHEDRKLAYLAGVLSFFLCLAVLSIPDGIMDFEFEAAIEGTRENVRKLLEMMNIRGDLNPSVATVKIMCSAFGGAIGMVTLLPAFRFSRAYYDLTTQHLAPTHIRFLFHLSFFGALLGAVLFTRPLTSDMILADTLEKCSPDDVVRDCVSGPPQSGFVTKESLWETVRLDLILAIAGVRVLVLRPYIQSYLSVTKTRAVSAVVSAVGGKDEKREVKAQRLSSQMAEYCAQMFQFICPATIQLVSPILLLVMFALVLHRRGGVAMGGCAGYTHGMEALGVNATAMYYSGPTKLSAIELGLQQLSLQLFDKDIELHKAELFPPQFYRALMSFFIWFSCASFFVMTCFGILVWRLRFAGVGADQDYDDGGDDDDGDGDDSSRKKGRGKKKRRKKGGRGNKSKQE